MDAVRAETKNGGGNGSVTKALRVVGMVFVGLVFALLFALVFGFLVKWLWNWLMPAVFGFKEITYWQAFAMVVLAKLSENPLVLGWLPEFSVIINLTLV